MKIPRLFVERTGALLEKYHIIHENQPFLIAFSGGKDSLLVNLILKELGYKTLAIHVNMGFRNSKEHVEYLLEMARKYSIEMEIFNVSSPNMQSMLPQSLQNKINERLGILFDSPQHGEDSYTPCTHCYNVKFLVLQYLAELYGVGHLALGHHGTDAVVSFFKSALMYIDRWDRGHETFSRRNFEQLIAELKKPGSEIRARAIELIAQDFAGTDEPPVKISPPGVRPLKIIRPLFGIFEHEIRGMYSNTSVRFMGDGCELGVKTVLTPRETIHHMLFDADLSLDLLEDFHKIIDDHLNEDGTVRFDARNNRNRLLGDRYKYSTLGESKL